MESVLAGTVMFPLISVIIIGTLVYDVHNDCPSLIAPPNGIVIGSNDGVCGTHVGSTCRIECRNKCQLIGDQFHTCLPNNEWSGQTTQCVHKTVRCRPRLSSPQNGYQVGRCRNWGGYVCTFACYSGFTLYGSSQITCQRRGHQWSASVPTCSPTTTTTTTPPVHCSTLSVPSNGAQRGSCQSDSAIPGSTCIFSCNSGYQLIGESVLVCTSDGTWSSLPPTCNRVQCPALTPPANGIYYGNCSPGVVQSSCYFKCNRGYHIVGSPTLVCQSNGLWSSSTPTCTRSDEVCPTPSPPPGAIIKSCNRVIGGHCYYRCNWGYAPHSYNSNNYYNSNMSMYSICSEDGLWKWSQTLICKPIVQPFVWFWRTAFPYG